jgi:hypothetical protein
MNLSKQLMATLSRQSAHGFSSTPKPQLVVVASNSAMDALGGRADRLQKAYPTISYEGALRRVYGNPANRHLVLEAMNE